MFRAGRPSPLRLRKGLWKVCCRQPTDGFFVAIGVLRLWRRSAASAQDDTLKTMLSADC